jgi:predicted  nucleic acid-binding Zn-ribbon protein
MAMNIEELVKPFNLLDSQKKRLNKYLKELVELERELTYLRDHIFYLKKERIRNQYTIQEEMEVIKNKLKEHHKRRRNLTDLTNAKVYETFIEYIKYRLAE